MMDDVYIMDVFNSVFVWIGPEANEEEKVKSMELALDYVDKAAKVDGRDPDCSIIRILAGSEPPMFTRWFHGWDESLAGKDIYAKQLELLKQKEGEAVVDVRKALSEYNTEAMKFSYAELRRDYRKKPLPNQGKGIDVAHLEKYLTDEEFLRVFAMNRDEFYTLPMWRQQNIKATLRMF